MSNGFNNLSEVEVERLAERGRLHDLTAEEVYVADRMGQELGRYRAFRGARSIHAMQAAEDRLVAEAKARADAQAELLKDEAKAAIRSGS